MSKFQRRLAEAMGKNRMTITVEAYDDLKKQIRDLEALARAAEAVIGPAMDILPDTYNDEIEAFWKLRIPDDG